MTFEEQLISARKAIRESLEFARSKQYTTNGRAWRQIEQLGSVRASNAIKAYWQLEEMGHALPIEPTRQVWELTEGGKQCLSESQMGSQPGSKAVWSRKLHNI